MYIALSEQQGSHLYQWLQKQLQQDEFQTDLLNHNLFYPAFYPFAIVDPVTGESQHSMCEHPLILRLSERRRTTLSQGEKITISQCIFQPEKGLVLGKGAYSQVQTRWTSWKPDVSRHCFFSKMKKRVSLQMDDHYREEALIQNQTMRTLSLGAKCPTLGPKNRLILVMHQLGEKNYDKIEEWSARICLLHFMRITRALKQLHTAGYVHHDFKPSQIVIDTMDRYRIVDFGTTRPVGPDQWECTKPVCTFPYDPFEAAPQKAYHPYYGPLSEYKDRYSAPVPVDYSFDVYSLIVIFIMKSFRLTWNTFALPTYSARSFFNTLLKDVYHAIDFRCHPLFAGDNRLQFEKNMERVRRFLNDRITQGCFSDCSSSQREAFVALCIRGLHPDATQRPTVSEILTHIETLYCELLFPVSHETLLPYFQEGVKARIALDQLRHRPISERQPNTLRDVRDTIHTFLQSIPESPTAVAAFVKGLDEIALLYCTTKGNIAASIGQQETSFKNLLRHLEEWAHTNPETPSEILCMRYNLSVPFYAETIDRYFITVDDLVERNQLFRKTLMRYPEFLKKINERIDSESDESLLSVRTLFSESCTP